ncbi:MAG: transporter [Burkholderiales bacterium]
MALVLAAACACAQELEPRAYSAAPVGTNFAVAGYSRVRGEVLTDPSLPITDIQARIDLYIAGYARTFALGGHTASLGLAVPFAQADVSGSVFEASHEVHRTGIGDVRLRLALNFLGNPALTPQEFAQRAPTSVAGASLSVVVPTGQYESSRLVNIGSNRWAFKPEIGISHPIGDWFVEASAGAWLFGDNPDFLKRQRRSQEALYVMQLHAGYSFRPGLWLAFNGAYASGGRTSVGGADNEDVQHNSRYGVTLSVPIDNGWSAKLAWSKGFATRAGGDYEILGLVLQYRWFDR